jgi:hypothetical protein
MESEYFFSAAEAELTSRSNDKRTGRYMAKVMLNARWVVSNHFGV